MNRRPAEAIERAAIGRAIAALTYDRIEQIDPASGRTIAEGEDIPLLRRSIANDLRDLERRLGLKARGGTILSAIAESIDEALLALAEASSAP